MCRFARPRGFLLVEAVLSSVVITVGLVFISRALGGQLSAIRRAEDASTMLRLARSQLILLEASLRESGVAAGPLEGACEAPFTAYAWQVTLEPIEAPSADAPAMTRVTMVVRHEAKAGGTVRLTTVWPFEWATPSPS